MESKEVTHAAPHFAAETEKPAERDAGKNMETTAKDDRAKATRARLEDDDRVAQERFDREKGERQKAASERLDRERVEEERVTKEKEAEENRVKAVSERDARIAAHPAGSILSDVAKAFRAQGGFNDRATSAAFASAAAMLEQRADYVSSTGKK